MKAIIITLLCILDKLLPQPPSQLTWGTLAGGEGGGGASSDADWARYPVILQPARARD